MGGKAELAALVSWLAVLAKMAQRGLGTGTLKNQVPVPAHLLAIARPSERQRMHQAMGQRIRKHWGGANLKETGDSYGNSYIP